MRSMETCGPGTAPPAVPPLRSCFAIQDLAPCLCYTKEAGGGLVVQVRELFCALFRKDCNRGVYKQKVGDPHKSREVLGVPLRLLCCRIWGGLCVGKSRACTSGRWDWLFCDMMFGAASWSSCDEALQQGMCLSPGSIRPPIV